MVTDFSAGDKGSGFKFCTAVHRRPRQGISHFGELLLSKKPRIGMARALGDSVDREATFVEYRAACGRRSACVDIMSVPLT